MCRITSLFIVHILWILEAFSVPPTINYAGQVSVNGQPFDGQGLFKFALLNADGNESLWSNDGTSANGSQPQTSVSVAVNGGLYSLLLGNTAMAGMGAIDQQVFAQHGDAKLRVWFSDGVNGFQQLSPDRPFSSVPYAFHSENAKSADSANMAKAVEAGAITPQMIQSSSITTAQLNEQILKYLKPEITTHPQAPGLIFSGQSMNLTSQAEGKFLTYQWNRNGQPIAGATAPSFSIAEVNGTLHDGNYSVVVSNDFGSVTSTPTTLQVDGTPSAHTVASIGMEMIFCPPGTFMMGSPTTEAGRGNHETQHQVTLTNGFYLGKYEVTQAQYQTVMNGNAEGLNADPSQFKGSNRPVEKVSWDDVQIFLTRLNSIEQSAGRLPNGWKYVLPTEAEWEYACRAGTTTAYSWGDDINSSLANYNWDGGGHDGNDSKQTVNIGQFFANPWGFYDMHGNVWEWVHDWNGQYLSGAQTDPEGPATGSDRIRRGGSWINPVASLRSAERFNVAPSYRFNIMGFRVAFQAIKPDTSNPELELLGETFINHEAGQAWSEPGVEAHDVRDGNITSSVSVTGTVDVNATGTYLLNYSVADASGNTATASRSVTVVDIIDPLLTLLGDANMTHAKNSLWVDPGATASDNLDGNLTSSITITGTVDVNTTGIYTLTYLVSDGAGNEVNATRTIYVQGEKQVTSAIDSEGNTLSQLQINQITDASSSTFYSISKNGTISINVSVEFRNDPILRWDSWEWWYSVTENNGGRYIQVLTKRNGPDELPDTNDDTFEWSSLWTAPGPGTGSGLKQMSESLSPGTYQGDGVVVTNTPIYGFRSGYGGQSSATQTFKLFHFAVKKDNQVIVWDLKQ